MMKSLILLGVCFILGAAEPAKESPAQLQDYELFVMIHTGGWGAGRLAEFRVQKDGAFTYITRIVRKRGEQPPIVQNIRGKLTPEQIDGLRKQVANAGDGLAAEDAGYVQFFWRDDAGKAKNQDYSMPRGKPCSELMKAADELAKKAASDAK